MWSKARTIVFISLAVIIIGLFIVNAIVTKPDKSYGAWSSAMTMGNTDADRHFIVYTDIFCPYCDNYSRVVEDNFDEFKRDYIDTNQVFYEIRLTDMISDHSVNSEMGGESGYCAADQGQFWDYYHVILAQLKVDYHDKGIGVSKTSPEIPKLDDEYFYRAARKISGIDIGKFETCLNNHEKLAELNQNTQKASKAAVQGLPYFVFGDWSGSGFDGNWKTVKSMFSAGGAN